MIPKYECVTTSAGIIAYIGDANVVAFDIETAPDDAFRDEEKAALDPHKSHIVGCSFSVKEGSGIYVPVAHKVGININPLEFYGFWGSFLGNTDVIKVAHNIAFEAGFAYHNGFIIKPPVYDTICAAQMTQNGPEGFRKLSDSGLKKLATEVLGEALPTFANVTQGKHYDELDAQDAETVRYGAADSDFALRLYNCFNEWFDDYLPKHRYIVEQIESPTAVYLGIMKHNGIPVNVGLLQERKVQAEETMAKLRDKIRFIIGDVAIGSNCSTNAFKAYLYGTLKLPVLKTTATNREAADDMSLVMLKEWCAGHRPELVPLFELVQEYRKWSKIKSTYLDGYLKWVNSCTGNIHPDIFALSTDTGRMNCRNPNAQNMPRKTNDPVGIRSIIAAPKDWRIISLDFSQIELRVGAFYCRDDIMLETYRTGGDIHAATTSVIFGVSYEEAQDKHRPDYKEQRTIAKNVNFGTFYGLFPRGLQSTLKFKAGVEKSVDECAEMLANLKAGYPNLVDWQETTKLEAAKTKYTETWLGRRRYLPNIDSDNWGQKSFAERCSLNTPIQGTAADILKLAIVRVLEGLQERPWLKPILQIHDEITFVVPMDKVDEAVAFVKECMEVQPFPEFDLPLVAEAAVGVDFGNMEEIEE